MESELQQDLTQRRLDAARSAASVDWKTFAVSPIVVLYVGPLGADRKSYHVHKDLLVTGSDFFRACLSSGMVEARKNEVTLSEDTSSQFDNIVGFMYTGKLGHLDALRMGEEELKERQLSIGIVNSFFVKDAMRLYNTAAKYGMPTLQNCIIDCLTTWLPTHISWPDRVLWSYETLGSLSPLTRLLKDELIDSMMWNPSLFDRETKDPAVKPATQQLFMAQLTTTLTNIELSISLFGEMAKGKPKRLEARLKDNRCLYHVHEEGYHCVSQKNQVLRVAKRKRSD